MSNKDAFQFIKRKIKDPLGTLRIIRELIIGLSYSFYYCLIKRNAKIGLPFYAGYRVRIIGPGKVIIGKNCSVFPNLLEGLSIVTWSSDTRVFIADNCCFGGTTIRAKDKIEIGEGIITANCLIQDRLIWHEREMQVEDYTQDCLLPREINIGKNVWIGAMSYVMPGTRVEDDVVLSAGSLTYNMSIQAYSLAAGNPVYRPVRIDRIVGLTGQK